MDYPDFAIYIENNFICIRIENSLVEHSIYPYVPCTNFANTIYQDFELLYNRMTRHFDYTFTIIDEDNYLTNISSHYDEDTNQTKLSLLTMSCDGDLLCQVENYIITENDLRSLKNFLNDLRAYLSEIYYVSFERLQ